MFTQGKQGPCLCSRTIATWLSVSFSATNVANLVTTDFVGFLIIFPSGACVYKHEHGWEGSNGMGGGNS